MKNSNSMLFPGCDFRDLGRATQRNNPTPRQPLLVEDDRRNTQHETHTAAVVATDPGMSGWGKAVGGLSICAWACEPGVDVEAVLRWVEARSDMENAQIVDLSEWEAPEDAAHLHIYVCNQGHAATCGGA